jgi:hypothetical protein
MNINIVGFFWPKEYSDIVMRSGYSIPHTREHLNIVNIVMRRILIHQIRSSMDQSVTLVNYKQFTILKGSGYI